MKNFFNSRKELIKSLSVLAVIMTVILGLGYIIKVLPQKPDYIVTLHYYTMNDTFTVPVSYGIKYKNPKPDEQKDLVETVYNKLTKPDKAYNRVIYSPVDDWALDNIIVEGNKLTLWLRSKHKHKAMGTEYDNNLLHSLIATYSTVPGFKKLTLVFLDRDDTVISLGDGIDTSSIEFDDTKKNFPYANIIPRYPAIASGSQTPLDKLKHLIPSNLIDANRTQYVQVYLLDRRLNLLVPVDIAVAPDENPDDIILKTLSMGAGWLVDEYKANAKAYKIKSYSPIYHELTFFVSPISKVNIHKAKRLGGRVDIDMDSTFLAVAANPKEYTRFIESLTHSYADSYSDLFDVKYFYLTVDGGQPRIPNWEYTTDKPMLIKQHINLMDNFLWPAKK